MYDLKRDIEDRFNEFSGYSPQELVDYAGISSIALDHEIAFQVCGQQILAAIELGDHEAVNGYIAVRPILAKSAFGLRGLKKPS